MEKEKLLEKLAEKGFSSKIIRAFKNIERESFVPEEYKKLAYEDTALPIGHGQSISQPQTIAFMLELLELGKNQKILEVGSGSGYMLALLSELVPAGEIFGTEIISELADSSKEKLSNIENIDISQADEKKLGHPEKYPFDRILVSASAQRFPEELLSQLKDPGIIVCPVLNSIIKIKKSDGRLLSEEYPGFTFVKLHHS